MSRELVHYYDVIQGKIVCGAPLERQSKSYSVFPEHVTCRACQELLNRKSGKTASK